MYAMSINSALSGGKWKRNSPMKIINRNFAWALLIFTMSCAQQTKLDYVKTEAIEQWPIFINEHSKNCFVNLRWEESDRIEKKIVDWGRKHNVRISGKVDQSFSVLAVDFISRDVLVEISAEKINSCDIQSNYDFLDFPLEAKITPAAVIKVKDFVEFSGFEEFDHCQFEFRLSGVIKNKFNNVLELFYKWNSGVTYFTFDNDMVTAHTNRNCHLDRADHATVYVDSLKVFGLKAKAH